MMSIKRKSFGIALAAILVAGGAGAIWLNSQTSAQISALGANGTLVSPDQQVRIAVEKALRAHQSLEVPPSAAVRDAPTSADLDATQSAGNATIADNFTGKQGATEKKALDSAVADQRSGSFRVHGGGIKNLSLKSVAITGSTATVTGVVDTWSEMSMKQPDGHWLKSRPENTLDFTMTLEQDAKGKWLANGFDFDFAPGTAP